MKLKTSEASIWNQGIEIFTHKFYMKCNKNTPYVKKE